VFEKINNDESRHLVVDFEVLDMIGHAKIRRLLIDFVGRNALRVSSSARSWVHH